MVAYDIEADKKYVCNASKQRIAKALRCRESDLGEPPEKGPNPWSLLAHCLSLTPDKLDTSKFQVGVGSIQYHRAASSLAIPTLLPSPPRHLVTTPTEPREGLQAHLRYPTRRLRWRSRRVT